MALTRLGPPVEGPAATVAPSGSGRPGAVRPHAEVPAPAGVALRALRLEALLGDPRDPANPYGLPALWAAGRAALPPAAEAFAATAFPPDAGRQGADQLVRVLRPLFRRDLALAHAWAVRPLASGPHPHPAAPLLAPAALTAAAGGALRGTARIVDGLGRHEPGVGQWRPVLAAAFADLLACESLTTVALRGLAVPGGGTSALVAAVGYLVPVLAGEVLEDLGLVLNECGFAAGSPERRALARLTGDRAVAQVDWTAAASWQALLVRSPDTFADPAPHPEPPVPSALFRLGQDATAVSGEGDPAAAVAAALTGAAVRPAPDGDPAGTALTRVARRLVTERRMLRAARDASAVPRDPADPAARALADRRALLLLASAVLGVRTAAAGEWTRFLGGPEWALLALTRITERLGAPLPGRMPDPCAAVWTELAARGERGADCDLYATKLLW